jgi:predicted DNA-binding transcriptional regulator YafY
VRFKERTLPAKDAAAYVSQSLQSYAARYEARVTVHAPASELEGRRWLGDVTALDEHRSEVRTSDDNLDWLAVRIAMISAPYEVHEPPELIERLRTMADGITRACSDRNSAVSSGSK